MPLCIINAVTSDSEPLFLTRKPAQAFLKSQYDEMKQALTDMGMVK